MPWGCSECIASSGEISAKVRIMGVWHLLAVVAAAAGPKLCPDAILHTILKDFSDYHDLDAEEQLFCDKCAAFYSGKCVRTKKEKKQVRFRFF